MRKLVITKKKKIKIFKKHGKVKNYLIKAAAMIMAVGVAAGSSSVSHAAGILPVPLQAPESADQIITYVYHQHIGNENENSGCYRQPVFHSHIGDVKKGGPCYQTPIYHIHEGNVKDGGPCYQTPVYHSHEGDGTAEEGCYKAVYHAHSGKCYKNISSSDYGCHTIKTVDTSDGDDGENDYKYYYMSCGTVVHGTNSSHTHRVLNCSKEDEIVGYELICGKTEETLEGYALSCTKPDLYIDSYGLSCKKTSEDIDRYAMNCGKEEDEPYGTIVVTRLAESKHKVTLTVQFENINGGNIQLSDAPFTWYDNNGSELGKGESITVAQNGKYAVAVGVVNEDVNKENLRVEMSVDSIRGDSGGSWNDNDDDDRDDKDSNDDDNSDDNEETQETTNKPSVSSMPSATPVVKDKVSATAAPPQTDSEISDRKEEDKNAEKPIPTTTPRVKKQTETVRAKEKKSEVEIPIEMQTVEKEDGFFSSPLAKVITVTLGTFAALTGVFILCYLLRWSVRIYNEDGQGNMIYLGRSMVRNEEDGYLVHITEQMSEKAVTGRYCIKPGLFRLGRGEEEILVERGQKRVSVSLQKEMLVII